MFPVQRKASLEQEMTGPVTDSRRREIEGELREVERRIQEAKQEQERYQEEINDLEKKHHKSSQERDEGRLSAVLTPVIWTRVHTIVLLTNSYACSVQRSQWLSGESV